MTSRKLVEKSKQEQDADASERATAAEPESLDQRLLDMQRKAGNRSVNAWVQTKLEVGAADDAYEQEADDIASTVVGHRGAPSGGHGGGDGAGDGFTASPQLASFVSRGGGAPLSTAVRRNLEPRFGLDFTDVRVHTDSTTGAMAESIGARAFTYGNDVYFGRGSYRPGSRDGDHLLAHELTHVAQQTGAAQRKIARSFDGIEVPTRLAQRRIQGNFFKKAKGAMKKMDDLKGKTYKDKRTQSGDKYLDQKSKPEMQDYMKKTKGGVGAGSPDWSNPKHFGEEPDKYVVKLAVGTEDANWLKNMKTFRNVALGGLLTSEGREDAKTAFSATNKEEKKAAKEKVVKKVLEKQGVIDGLSDEDIKKKVTEFTEGINSVGHAWIRLETYVGGELKDLYSYGMWPAKISSLVDANVQLGGFGGFMSVGQGEVRHPDSEHEGDSNKAYFAHEAKKKNFDKALSLADERYQNPPNYVLMGYNCTAFAREIFKAAGGTYPAKGTLLPGFAYTPGNLYAAIAKKAEKEDEKKDKGEQTKGKYSKKDDQEQFVGKARKQQSTMAQSGHRDEQAKFAAVPPDGAKERTRTFYARRTFKYGTRPEFPLDNELTLDETRRMTLVDNDPALFAFGVETYKVGPKQYWFLARDQAEQAMVPKKLPPLPARQKVKGPPKLKTYVGGQNDPPGNDAEAADAIDVAKLGDWVERKRVGDWVRVFDTSNQEAYWVKASSWDHYYKPTEGAELKVGEGKDGEEKDGGEVAEPMPVPIYAFTEAFAVPKAGEEPIGHVSGDDLEDCKVMDRDEGWVELQDKKSNKKFYVREDAYKYALDPKRNAKPMPWKVEEEKDDDDDDNLLLELGDDDNIPGLTFLLEESPETSDEFAVTKDRLTVYRDPDDGPGPMKTLDTDAVLDGDPYFSDGPLGWKSLSINYIENYSVKEVDYERWMVLTGQKEPEEVLEEEKSDTSSTSESENLVTADEFPVYLNKGDPEPLRMMTADEMKAAFNVDWVGVDGDGDWVFLEINMSDNYAVRRGDYEKWLELSGG